MLAELIDLALPRACVGCARPGTALCAVCGALDPVPVAESPLPVIAAGRYDAGLRTALIAYKERGRRDLGRPLGALLAAVIAQSAAPDAVLVPVPSSAAARRARGGDHVLRLARSARRYGAGRAVTALRLVRPVADSAGLDIAGRAANLADAFAAASPRHPRQPALIVDDITTTGATLAEASRALGWAGWSVAGAAVIAATPRIHPAVTSGMPPRAGLP